MWEQLAQLSPTDDHFLDGVPSPEGDGDPEDLRGSSDTFLTALTSPEPDPRLSWVSTESWSPSQSRDTVDTEAFPITDIQEEPGESAFCSSSSSDGESSTLRDDVIPSATQVPPGGAGNDTSPSASSGHLNHSFSASDEELNQNTHACPLSDNRAESRSRSSTASSSSSSSASAGSFTPGDAALDTFQDFDTSPAPIPPDVEASTPLAHLEPKVIVVDNGNSAQDSDDPMEDFFHNNHHMALDTTPVLSPSNSNHAPGGAKGSEPHSDTGSADDVSNGEGQCLPEGETPLLPPTGTSPVIQPNIGWQKVKAKKNAKTK